MSTNQELPEWVMVAALEVDAAVEADWDRWYDEVHLPEIIAAPGFRSGTRYRAVGHPSDGTGLRRQLTVYEVAGPEVWETPELTAARGLGGFGDKVQVRTRIFHKHLTLRKDDVR